MNIDLGCGTKRRRKLNKTENFIGVDYTDYGQEIIHDITKFPYPFESNSVDTIYSAHCIENVLKSGDDLTPILKEMYRISKPNANWILVFPHWTRTMNDPSHKIALGVDFLKTYIKDTHADVDNRCSLTLKVDKLTYRWRKTGTNFWDRILFVINLFWSFILNLNMTFTEHFLVYKLGGIQEFKLEITVLK